jgi:hypothetical protein
LKGSAADIPPEPSCIGPPHFSERIYMPLIPLPRQRTDMPNWDCNLNGVTPETEETLVTVVMMEAVTGSVQGLDGVDEQLVRQLAERARAEGLKLTGEGGLLARLTKVGVESALEGEMDDCLG